MKGNYLTNWHDCTAVDQNASFVNFFINLFLPDYITGSQVIETVHTYLNFHSSYY